MNIHHFVVDNQPYNGYISTMINRYIISAILESLKDTPVIFINGPRQSGKSTLVRWLAEYKYPAKYFNLDDFQVLNAVQQSPKDFIQSLESPVIIDEAQKAPGLFPAIKMAVDSDRRPGRYILTGSANVQLLPTISESLAGRIEILTLWPFSQSEITQNKLNFIDQLFAQYPLKQKNISSSDTPTILQKMVLGGYPEIQKRTTPQRRDAWFSSYITALLQRDILDISHINGISGMPNLLSILASRAASLFNFADFSRISSIPQSSLKRYLSLLEMIFLITRLPAWSSNIGKRLLKSPKVLFCDTGLLSYLLQFTSDHLNGPNPLQGQILENFVIMEIKKEISWSLTKPNLFHFRTTGGIEVDLILENRKRELVAIEIKSKAVVEQRDLKGLLYFRDQVKGRFLKGIVFYTGNQVLPLGNNMFAVPIPALWEPGS